MMFTNNKETCQCQEKMNKYIFAVQPPLERKSLTLTITQKSVPW